MTNDEIRRVANRAYSAHVRRPNTGHYVISISHGPMATAGDKREAVAVAAEIHHATGMGASVYDSAHSGIKYFDVWAFPRRRA
jgi:hypothetical protein